MGNEWVRRKRTHLILRQPAVSPPGLLGLGLGRWPRLDGWMFREAHTRNVGGPATQTTPDQLHSST